MRIVNMDIIGNPWNWLTVGAMIAISTIAFFVILSRCDACDAAFSGAANDV